jgi:hypothetical protein
MFCTTQRAARRRLPLRTGMRSHASRVSASNRSAVNLPSLSSSMPAAYFVKPDRSDCGRRPLSRHFWAADGRIPNRLPTFVRPIWSIALATVLLMSASLHRKCKLTIDRKCKRRASHFRHGERSAEDVLGQARRSESGHRLAIWPVGHRARARHLAVSGEEVARWPWATGPAEPDRPCCEPRRQYGMAKDGPRA